MTALKWLLVLALVGYGGGVALMYFAQRALMYFPDKTRISPDSVGLPQAERPVAQTEDGERLILWHVPAREEKPVVIYFQGNGGGLDLRADRFRRIGDARKPQLCRAQRCVPDPERLGRSGGDPDGLSRGRRIVAR